MTQKLRRNGLSLKPQASADGFRGRVSQVRILPGPLVVVHPTSPMALTVYRGEDDQEAGQGRAEQQEFGWVLSSQAGTPISVHKLHNRSWKPLLERAGLSASTRIHHHRHLAATLLLSKGVAVKVVSEMPGHADVSTALSIYAHVLPDMQSTAADAADEALVCKEPVSSLVALESAGNRAGV